MSIHDHFLNKGSWDGHINAPGLGIIQAFEGFSAAPYRCPAARWTIGWGCTWDHRGNPVTAKHPAITKKQAEHLLRQEVSHSEGAVRRLIKAPLNENQFSACVSLCFNIGSGNFQKSTLRMKLNRLDYEGASAEFPKWRRSLGKVLSGLVRRRAAERLLFDTPV